MAKLRVSKNYVHKTKEYVDSKRFRVVSGHEYVVDGDVAFPDDPYFEKYFHDGIFPGEYWSHIGLRFQSNTNVYSCDNDGIRGAVRRLTCIRVPDEPGKHYVLKRNQRRFVERDVGVKIWKKWFQDGMKRRLCDICHDSEEFRQIWTDAAHQKRELRRAARRGVICDGRTGGVRVRRVDYKCKSKEILKNGKYLRAIGDLTAPGSTVGCYLMDEVKRVFSEEFDYKGGTCKYIKPSRKTLLDNFDDLINLKRKVYFNFFSDDSNCAVKCSDGILRCNCDISACDGSNFEPIFKLLKNAINVDQRYYKDIENLFAQLKCRAEISSTQNKRKENREKMKVVLEPIGSVLYSGSGTTTIVNNCANTLIYIAFMNVYDENDTKAEAAVKLEEAAATAGYILKCEVCENIQELQFLKYSPTEQGGMFLNLGVILRSFGLCKGDIPYVKSRKNMSIADRAKGYICDVVDSHKHNGDSSVMRAIRETYPRGDSSNLNDEGSVWRIKSEQEDVCQDSDLIARYKVTQSELEDLCHTIKTCVGPHIARLKSVDKILSSDYGY